jgi:soluble lytic murein transglycosylase
VATDPEEWPHDPLLERARLLSDLGLDGMAVTEIELLAPRAAPRAVDGLRALVLARRNERRPSIQSLRRTFTRLGTAHQAPVPLDARRMYYPLDFYEVVAENARRHDLSPYLLMALIRQESAFDQAAVSRSGARGLMQIMPATGRELAAKAGLPFSNDRLLEPAYSARLGATYLRQVLDMFEGNVELALAGYNGGPYRIKRWWHEARGRRSLDEFIEDLELSETRDYVHRIVLFADSYRQLYGTPG